MTNSDTTCELLILIDQNSDRNVEKNNWQYFDIPMRLFIKQLSRIKSLLKKFKIGLKINISEHCHLHNQTT